MNDRTHRIPGLILTDHNFEVPLDHEADSGPTIQVFAREVRPAEEPDSTKPFLVFYQGGPGSPSPRPTTRSGWIDRALEDYRVLLLDQRGTGRSSPLTAQTVAGLGSPEAVAAYFRNFRADSIVRDAELIRERLADGERWAGLGQSYGGFCLTTYLSIAPEGLSNVYITGGVPPVHRDVDDVYRATYRRVHDRNRRYFQRYPEDRKLLSDLYRYLRDNEVILPAGGHLTARRLLHLGSAFGMSDGFEAVHYLLESAWVDGASGRELSRNFLRGVESAVSFETNPIYTLLHEPIYSDGPATRWSAERVRSEFPDFGLDTDHPLFTGEMVYPSMCEDYLELRPLAEAAHLLADFDDWSLLYDVEVLHGNDVPSAAVAYHDDMYVEREFSEETTAGIPRFATWITNEYDHNGLRADGAKILDRLIKMARDV